MNVRNDTEYYSQSFSHTDEESTVFNKVIFDTCNFDHCNLSGAEFNACKFIDCSFNQSNLSNISLKHCRLSDVEFYECKLVGVDWTKADWPRLNLAAPIMFKKCIMNDSTFFGLELTQLIIEDCKAHDVDFRDGNFTQANFTYTDFNHSLFSKTRLREADFSEALNYNIDVFNNEIKSAKFSRFEAVRLLSSLGIELVD